MSNALKRRMAKVALVIAAGAAPVVASAGSASALSLPTTDLGGLSNLDTASLGDKTDSALQNTSAVAGELGGEAVKAAVPAVGKAAGSLSRSATEPSIMETAGAATGAAATVVGETTSQLNGKGLPGPVPGLNAPLPAGGVPGMGLMG